MPLYPPNTGPILPGVLGSSVLGAQASLAAVAAGTGVSALNSSTDYSSEWALNREHIHESGYHISSKQKLQL